MKRQFRVKLRKKNGPTITAQNGHRENLMDDQWLVFAAPGFSSDFWIEVSPTKPPTKPADRHYWRALAFENHTDYAGALVTDADTSDETHWCKKGLRRMGIEPRARTLYWRRMWEAK